MEHAHLKLKSDLAKVVIEAKLDAKARNTINDSSNVPAAITRLEAAQAYDAALRLYALALPHREAVWWASMCAAGTRPANQPPPEQQAREAAEHWVRQQDDPSRRAAMAAARAAGFRAAESWAAVAAFWSTGSIAPEGQPIVPPGPHLAGTAVHGAVALAAVRDRPQLRADRIARFLASAHDIASGGGGFVPPDPP